MQIILQKKLEAKKKNKCKKNSRQAFSAEAFGIFNKKADFIPKVIPKDETSIQQIRGLV